MYNFKTTYTNLNENLFQIVELPEIHNPFIILHNEELQKELGMRVSSKFLEEELLGYNCSIKPFAQAYAGHQFGHFVILGDGRAMILGEHIIPNNKRFDIQLKGSGRTKYSRGGDGKATASSMIREYVYSYAINKLKIPTSKSLAVITLSQPVLREEIYDGAILIRVMTSHIRFGTFEFASKYLSENDFKQFVDYVIERHYSKLMHTNEKYILFFEEVTKNTINMVVDWYRVGFIHGVMNTDNMSIIGETFDYGPCAFLNRYNPKVTYSEIDTYRRYSFENQRKILKWNLNILAKTLFALADKDKLQNIVDSFDKKFDLSFNTMMKRKLGIKKEGDYSILIEEFLNLLKDNELDYTNTFLELMYPDTFTDSIYQSKDFETFRKKIKEVGLCIKTMEENNPQRIVRNYILEDALQDYHNNKNLYKVHDLLKAISQPYTRDGNLKKFQKPPRDDFDKKYKTHCNT